MIERKKRSLLWYTPLEDLRALVINSFSISEVLKKLGYKAVTGTISKVLKQRLLEQQIDTSHFLSSGRRDLCAKKLPIPLHKVMVCGSEYSRKDIKRRLLSEKIIENKCSNCGQLPLWDDKPLVMVLDHINGVNNDNRKDNLRLLCPNCNSQTATFTGRNTRQANTGVKFYCADCGKGISRNSKHCALCAKKHTLRRAKIVWDDEKLRELITCKPVVQIAMEFGVSDTAVRKRCRLLGIDYKVENPYSHNMRQ